MNKSYTPEEWNRQQAYEAAIDAEMNYRHKDNSEEQKILSDVSWFLYLVLSTKHVDEIYNV
jgi:hypothetical protein